MYDGLSARCWPWIPLSRTNQGTWFVSWKQDLVEVILLWWGRLGQGLVVCLPLPTGNALEWVPVVQGHRSREAVEEVICFLQFFLIIHTCH